MLSNYEYGVPVNACSLMYSACLKCLGLVYPYIGHIIDP